MLVNLFGDNLFCILTNEFAVVVWAEILEAFLHDLLKQTSVVTERCPEPYTATALSLGIVDGLFLMKTDSKLLLQ